MTLIYKRPEMLIFLALITFLMIPHPTYAITKGNLEAYILTQEVAGIAYTPHCFGTCHLPLIFRWSGNDFSLQKSELKSYKQQIIGTDGIYDVKLKYLKNETWIEQEWIPNKFCETKYTSNSTPYQDCVDNGYFVDVEKFKLVWSNVPSTINIKKDKWYYIDFIGYRTPSTNYSAIDIVPEIKGILFPEFAWWNSSISYCRNISIEETDGEARTFAPIDYYLDVSGWGNKPYNNSLRLVDQPCDNGGNEIGYAIYNATYSGNNYSTFNLVSDELNFTIGENKTGSLYYDVEDVGIPNYDTDSNFNILIHNYQNWTIHSRFMNVSNVNDTLAYSGQYEINMLRQAYNGDANYDNDLTNPGANANDGLLLADDVWTPSGSGQVVLIMNNSYKRVLQFNYSDASVTKKVNITLWRNSPYVEFDAYYDWSGSQSGGWWAFFGANFINPGNSHQFLINVTDGWTDTVTSYADGSWHAWLTTNWNQSKIEQYMFGMNNTSVGWGIGFKKFINSEMDYLAKFNMNSGSSDFASLVLGKDSHSFVSGDFVYANYIVRLDDNWYAWPYNESYFEFVNPVDTFVLGAEQQNLALPVWSNNVSTIISPYNTSQSEFNITWVGAVSVNIELNDTGTPYNCTASNSYGGNIWNCTRVLEANFGNDQYWKSYGTNATGTNVTPSWNFTIAQADNIVNLYLNGTQNNDRTYNYPESVNATATSTTGTVYLYRDGTHITNGTSPQSEEILLGNGTYTYKTNATGNENYSDNTTGLTFYALINKGTSNTTVNFNTSDSVTEGTIVNVSCSYSPAEITANLYNNTSQSITNPYEFDTTGYLGDSNFTCNTTGNANYTSAEGNRILNVFLAGALTIHRVYDENNASKELTFSVTIYNSTYETTSTNLTTYDNNEVRGDLTITISSTGYGSRRYYVTIPENETYNMSGYLLNNSDGQNVGITTKDIMEQPISDTEIDVLRLIGTNWTIVAQGRTDDIGKFTFHLDPDIDYKINLYREGYNVKNTTLIPTEDEYIIFLYREIVDMPPYWTYWRNVTWSCGYDNATRIFECNYTDTSTHLELIILNITELTMTISSHVCGNSSTASNGTLRCTIPADYQNRTYVWTLYGDFGSTDSRLTLGSGDITPDLIQFAWGVTGIIVSIILWLISGFVGFEYNPAYGIFLTLGGVFFTFWMGFLTIPEGIMTTVVGFFIAGGLLMIKVEKNE